MRKLLACLFDYAILLIILFFPKGESINLDPELQTACEGDVSDFCSNVSPGQAQVCTEKVN